MKARSHGFTAAGAAIACAFAIALSAAPRALAQGTSTALPAGLPQRYEPQRASSKDGFGQPIVLHNSEGVLSIRIRPDLCADTRNFANEDMRALYCHDVGNKPQTTPLYLPNFNANDVFALPGNPNSQGKYDVLGKKTLHFAAIAGVALVGASHLPQETTLWQHRGTQGMGKRWKENVKAGPTMDKDPPFVNGVLHPLAGSGYYTMARQSGLDPGESFIYAVLMSTFFWEFGLEATLERPSIQDLVITPVVGAILGEISYQLIRKIDENEGRVLGSSSLGTALKIALAPFDAATRATQKALEPWLGQTRVTIAPELRFEEDDRYRAYRGEDSGLFERGVTAGFRVRVELPLNWDKKLLGIH